MVAAPAPDAAAIFALIDSGWLPSTSLFHCKNSRLASKHTYLLVIQQCILIFFLGSKYFSSILIISNIVFTRKQFSKLISET
jgi:hypothetical protein